MSKNDNKCKKNIYTQTYVPHLPKCDMPQHKEKKVDAHFDAKTTYGVWAYLCRPCFNKYGTGLGLGKGQKLILAKEGGEKK